MISQNWYVYHDGSSIANRVILKFLNSRITNGDKPFTIGKSGYYYGIINGEPFRRKECGDFNNNRCSAVSAEGIATSIAAPREDAPSFNVSRGGWYIIATSSAQCETVMDYLSARSKTGKRLGGTSGKAYGLDNNQKGRCRAISGFEKDGQRRISVNDAYRGLSSAQKPIPQPIKYAATSHRPPVFEEVVKERVVEKVVNKYVEVAVPVISDVLPSGRKVLLSHIKYDARYRSMNDNDLYEVVNHMNADEFDKLTDLMDRNDTYYDDEYVEFIRAELWGTKPTKSLSSSVKVHEQEPVVNQLNDDYHLPEAIVIPRRKKRR